MRVEQRAERAAVVALSCGPDTALQLLWRDDRLCYTTNGSTSFVSSEPITLRQWTHVVTSQSVHKLRSSSVSMFINGKQIQSNVANKTPLIEKKSKWLLGHAPGINVFKGQIASMRLFFKSIDSPNAMICFENGPTNNLPEKLENNIVLNWNPNNVHDFVVFDSSLNGKNNASILSGTLIIEHFPLAQSIDCCGGVKCFLPLIELLRAEAKETNKTAIEVDDVPSIHTQSVSPQRELLDEKGNDSARRPSKGVALWKMRNESKR